MFRLKNAIGSSPSFFIPIFLFFTIGILVHFYLPYDVISLEVNKRNTYVLDVLFKNITHLGDGIFVVCIGLMAFWINRVVAQKILVSYGFVSIICTTLKQLIFKGMPRPIEHFKDIQSELNMIEGFQPNHLNTFPSGHTAAAFGLFTVLAFYIKNPWLQGAFAILTIFIGFSRVYLFEHFLRDVLAGALIGCLSAILTEYIFNKKRS
ncbi:MAG: phosphatase PAP2 family protein [Saprospiraceae bacterium]|nr:phosphatase PAP2 family protein [Saprospiraceae bacterium]